MKFDDMKIPKIIAHRGDVQIAPENTMPAFEKAIEKGADTIEFDIHLTKDEQIAIFHDYYISRTSNGNGYIGDFSLLELQSFDVGMWFNEEFNSLRIPTLSEVLDLGKNNVRFEIEIKTPTLKILGKLINEILKFDVMDDVEITTPHHPLLYHLHSLHSIIQTGYFVKSFPKWKKRELAEQHTIDWMKLLETKVAHIPFPLLTELFVQKLKGNGFLIHGSDLNTKHEIRTGFELGIDQFSTDNLSLALEMRCQKKN